MRLLHHDVVSQLPVRRLRELSVVKRSHNASRIALTAILCALSLMVLYLSCLVPTARAGVVAVAGLMPAVAVVSAGPGAGALCYAGTGILGLLLAPDKGNALLYLLFFGLYPLVKYGVERIRKLPLELLLKLIFFNAVQTLFLFGMREIFFAALPVGELALWLIYLAGNAAFLVYDFGFTKLIGFYVARVDAPLRKGRP